ncbi:Nonhomologous end-joining factor 1 [Nesidiocoris tenuis]|uniref:Non-homologous end-joining factor 1 n=1 Tax=Nesidiocoris tenuis TaxID=355587 RepID=A0ABN7AUP2_9HEMI|nr:Nonhomologous end-joining factor 1 [Nesidiocoris tenuis]
MRKDVQGSTIALNVTNLKKLWRVKLSEDDLLKLFRSQNPIVQAKPEWIVSYVNSCFNSSDLVVQLEIRDNTLSVEMVKPSSEIKVKLTFTLEEQDSSEFFREITNPMVAVINQLVEQRSKLLNLVKSKDLELAEYRLEGANISRKNVETDEVIEKEFFNNCTTEFIDRIRVDQTVSDLVLPQDLAEIYSEATRIRTIDNQVEPSILPAGGAEKESLSPNKTEHKRPLGSSVIVQVPRVKQRKKNFNL